MSVVDTARTEAHGLTPDDEGQSPPAGGVGDGLRSPFASNELYGGDAGAGERWDDTAAHREALASPFREALATLGEDELEREAVRALEAELEDEEFDEALEALANDAAARHLHALSAWSGERDAAAVAEGELEQWFEQIANAVDDRLAALEERFGDRPIESLTEGELRFIELPAGEADRYASPLDAQEDFLKKIFRKVRNVARKVGGFVKKGIKAIGKILPLGRLWAALRKLIRPLLRRVLQRAIGRLPSPVRPLAQKLARRFGLEAEAASESALVGFGEDEESLAEAFDGALAQLLLAPDAATEAALVGEFEAAAETRGGPRDPVAELDIARRRLAEQLAGGERGTAPVEQMEQFIPVVMAAMPLIRLGVRVIGRGKVVNFVAKLLAQLIQGMVGKEAATVLSRHLADTGLGLLGLEAESDPVRLGAEALVAAVEDTVGEVFSLSPESLENELLVEAVTQEAFADAAVRHLPAAVLRPDLQGAASEDEGGVWVVMPRGPGRTYRYKQYSRAVPVVLSRPMAARIVLSEGDTLEERLLDSGVNAFPVQAEVHLYEALPGMELGQVAVSELEADVPPGEAALELEELVTNQPLPIGPAHAARARVATPPGAGRRAGPPRPGSRYYRLRVRGVRLRRRPRFAVRLDLTATKPALLVRLRLGERDAHLMARHLAARRHVQLVAGVRRLLGPTARQALAARLERSLGRRGARLAPAAALQLANTVSDGMLRAVAQQLPAAAPALARAAQDPARGLTLTFEFRFASGAAIGTGTPEGPSLSIAAGSGGG